ncbi:MAG: hypothetical protein J2P31_19970, partial [Blastocatellia bacterium]|nr:hypothetical protein [Blastocatellia bacterium]
ANKTNYPTPPPPPKPQAGGAGGGGSIGGGGGSKAGGSSAQPTPRPAAPVIPRTTSPLASTGPFIPGTTIPRPGVQASAQVSGNTWIWVAIIAVGVIAFSGKK